MGSCCYRRELTDDRSLLKDERKRPQVVNAPKKSARAAMIKIADKTSNLRAIANSPPVDWSVERKRAYAAQAAEVFAGLPAVPEDLHWGFLVAHGAVAGDGSEEASR